MPGILWLWGVVSTAHGACDGAAVVTVVINELRPDATGPEGASGADDELVELFNAGGAEADLSGWTLRRLTAAGGRATLLATLPAPTVLGPGGHLLVAGTGVAGAHVTVAGLDQGSGLRGDLVVLQDCGGVREDGVLYGGPNADLLDEDDGSVPARGAPRPGAGACLARRLDGADTDRSAADLAVTSACTPGGPNLDLGCRSSAGGVLLTELRPDPAGIDLAAGTEFVELLHTGGAAKDLRGWSLVARTSMGTTGPNELTAVAFGPGVTLQPGGRLVVGGSNVPSADVRVPTLDLPSGAGGDLLLLVDCAGDRADGVLYGSTNLDGLDEDDAFVPATGAGAVAVDACVVRQPDGVDTDRSADDFVVLATCTPGEANPAAVAPQVCEDPPATVRLNEVLPNPAGADGTAGTEFIELHNGGTEPAEVGGWQLVARTSALPGEPPREALLSTLPDGASVPAGGFLVVGDVEVPEATYVVPGLGVPNGSGGDLLLLLDCEGVRVDSLRYGPTNDDGLDEDGGDVPTAGLGAPGDDVCVLRAADGADTDDALRDLVLGVCTPGASNAWPATPGCDRAAGSVVINELLPNPEGPDAEARAEFVELFNPTEAWIDLSLWSLARQTSGDVTELAVLPVGTGLAGGAFLLVGDEQVEGAEVVAPLDLGSGSGGDVVMLRDAQGHPVDVVLYGAANHDGLEDDDCSVPAEGPGLPGEDACVARRADGVDSGASAVDFVVTDLCTPGAPNVDRRCEDAGAAVVINELLPDPRGVDSVAGTEFVELHAPGDRAVRLGGWQLVKRSRGGEPGTPVVTLDAASRVEPGGFFVVGGLFAEQADQYVERFDLLSGSGGDQVLLLDCAGAPVDSVIYGGRNQDGLAEDDGHVPDHGAPDPPDDACLGRLPDGVDTNRSELDVARLVCSPGAPNDGGSGGVDGGGAVRPVAGCGCGEEGWGLPPAEPVDARPGEGCSSVPPRALPATAGLLLAALRRRRRAVSHAAGPTGAPTR